MSVYYGSVPFASRVSIKVRRKMFDRFMEVMKPGPTTTILDVGCTSDQAHPESNFFEQWYPWKNRLTCVGTEYAAGLKRYGIDPIQIVPGTPLPFKADTFDIVFSNAVLEHVGNTGQQQFFIQELQRVSRRYFITTPYRYFPIEHHTGLPLLHWLPWKVYRTITPYAYWRHEENLHLLSRRDLRALFSLPARIEFVKAFGLPSNMVAYS